MPVPKPKESRMWGQERQSALLSGWREAGRDRLRLIEMENLMGHSSFISLEDRGDMVFFWDQDLRMQTLEETQPILRSTLRHKT